MKFELRNVKHAAFASEETECFSAKLYADGKYVADCDNQGHGGPTTVHYKNNADREMLLAFFKSLPKKTVMLTDRSFEYAQTDETCVDDLLSEYLKQKQYKSWCKKKTVFHLKDQAEGAFFTINRPYSSEMSTALRNEHGDKLDFILNERIAS